MNHNARESLSALMDNEGDELELRRVLKALDETPDAADAWRRYHLARSLMHRDRDIDVDTDLSAGIMAAIADDPLPVIEKGASRSRGVFSFAGSAAVAAAVSLMVITGVQVYRSGDTPGQPDMASTGAQAPSGAQPAAGEALRPSLVDLPLFQSQSSSANRGVMTVGAEMASPMFMAPGRSQSQRVDQEQARILQSYLDRHAEGSAYRSGDAWMSLLRASGHETLGLR